MGRRGLVALFAGLFAGCVVDRAQPASADNALEILTRLKGSHSTLKQVLESSKGALEKDQAAGKNNGVDVAAKKVASFNNKWMSLIGWSEGMMGLAKDFAVNYLGRSSYHDHNGPLIGAIKELQSTIVSYISVANKATGKGQVQAPQTLQEKSLRVCDMGLKLFKTDGSLGKMFSDLKSIMSDKVAFQAMGQAIITNETGVSDLLSYASGPRAAGGADDEL